MPRKLVAAYRDTVYYALPIDDLSGLVAAVSQKSQETRRVRRPSSKSSPN